MNCRGCGRPIPERCLKLDSFECPYCGRKYHRRPTVNTPDSNTRQPVTKEPVKYPKKKYTWVKVCAFVVIAILVMVFMDREYGFFGLLGGGLLIGVALGVLYGIAKIKYEKKNPTVQVEIVNEVKQGNHSLVTFREIHADGNAEIKLIRSNSAQYPLELTLMQTLENTRTNKAASPVETPTKLNRYNGLGNSAGTKRVENAAPERNRRAEGGTARHEPSKMKKPYEMSAVFCGAPLAYEYNDVQLYIPDRIELDHDMPDVYHKSVSFRPEPDNAYDSKTIAVYYDEYGNGRIIRSHFLGYMYSGKLRDMVADYIKFDRILLAVVEELDMERKIVVLHLGFYRERYPSKSETYRLTRTSSREIQENIDSCSEGDEVEIDLAVDDEERYEASCNGLTIGYFPAKAKSVVEKFPPCAIERIETDDNDRSVVYVTCFVDQ